CAPPKQHKVQRPKAQGLRPISLHHPIHHLNLPGYDFLLGFLCSLNSFGRNHVLVIAINHVAYTVGVQTKDAKAALESMVDYVLDDGVNRIVNALHHAGQNKSRLYHVLIRINADHEMSGAATRVSSGLLDCIESAETRITRGSENDVRAFADLSQRNLFSFTV